MNENLLKNAELVKSIALNSMNKEIDYNQDGVVWLNFFIESQRINQPDKTVLNNLPNTLGSFLGECICRVYSGVWVLDPDYGWSVKINSELTAYPFATVRKQIERGASEGETVLDLFNSIAPLLSANSKVIALKSKEWWKFW